MKILRNIKKAIFKPPRMGGRASQNKKLNKVIHQKVVVEKLKALAYLDRINLFSPLSKRNIRMTIPKK